MCNSYRSKFSTTSTACFFYHYFPHLETIDKLWPYHGVFRYMLHNIFFLKSCDTLNLFSIHAYWIEALWCKVAVIRINPVLCWATHPNTKAASDRNCAILACNMIQGPNLEFNKNVFTHNIKKLRMIVIRFKVCHYFPIHYGKVCPMGKQFSILTRTWIGNETIVKGMNPCSTKPIGCLNPTLTTVPCKKKI